MQNPEQQIDDYQEQIFWDIVTLLNSRLQLLKELSSSNLATEWTMGALAGLHRTIYYSLFDNLIVTLAWLFSNKNVDKRSLFWYLKQVRNNCKKFSKDEIDTQLAEIEKVRDEISKITTMRDQWIAHRDSSAFNNREEFLEENEIEIRDLETLVNLAESIIDAHFGEFKDCEVDFTLPSNDFKDVINGLKQLHELVFFLNEFDISFGKPDFEDHITQARKNLTLFNY